MDKRTRETLEQFTSALMGYKYCPVTMWERKREDHCYCSRKYALCCTFCKRRCVVRCVYEGTEICTVACTYSLKRECEKRLDNEEFEDCEELEDFIKEEKGLRI